MSDAHQMTPKETLQAYESLKRQEKSIKQQLEELKPLVLDIVPEDKEIALEFGTIVRSPGRISWKYSTQIKQREEALKEDKKLEEQNGTAKAVYGDPFVTYREKETEE